MTRRATEVYEQQSVLSVLNVKPDHKNLRPNDFYDGPTTKLTVPVLNSNVTPRGISIH